MHPGASPARHGWAAERSALPRAVTLRRMSTPTVLFVCVHNAGRSQMAAGFLRELGGERVEVR